MLVRDGVRPHRLLVTAYDDGLVKIGSRFVDLDGEPVPLPDWAGRVVVPNTHGETFARLRLGDRSWAAVADGLGSLADDLARSVLWATAMDAVASRALTFETYLTLVERHLLAERHSGLVTAVADVTLGPLLVTRVGGADAAAVHERLAAACRAGLANGGHPVAFTRGLARASRDRDELRRWLAEGRTDHDVTLDPRLRWAAVHRLALLGDLDADGIEAERRRDGTAEGDLGAASALAARPLPEAKEAAWSELVADDVSNRRWSMVSAGLWSAEQAELAAPYFPRYLDAAPRLAERGPAFAQVVGEAAKRLLLDPSQVEQLRDALTGEVPTVLRRCWEDALDDRS